MSVEQKISDRLLEEMLAAKPPCGGVALLGIPPCGAIASFVLDRRNIDHPCRGKGPAAFKCVDCYQMWLDAVILGMAAGGGMVCCRLCNGYFDRVADFARYVPLC
jgi:hypothetical protein